MTPTAATRLAEFESRARHAPGQVLRHLATGWRYIAIHPFADDHQLLDRLNWPADRCVSVDAYWECAGDVCFLQVVAHAQSIRAPGVYYRWTANAAYAANLVAVLDPRPISREAFESLMNRFVKALPLPGAAQALTALPER